MGRCLAEATEPTTDRTDATKHRAVAVEDAVMYKMLTESVSLAYAVPERLFEYPRRLSRKEAKSHHERPHWEYIDVCRPFLASALAATKGRNLLHTPFLKQLEDFLDTHGVKNRFRPSKNINKNKTK